jgi:hypothetical protein
MIPLQGMTDHSESVTAMLDQLVGFVTPKGFSSTETVDGLQYTGFPTAIVTDNEIKAGYRFDPDLMEIS